jgi:hypothetical protein
VGGSLSRPAVGVAEVERALAGTPCVQHPFNLPRRIEAHRSEVHAGGALKQAEDDRLKGFRLKVERQGSKFPKPRTSNFQLRTVARPARLACAHAHPPSKSFTALL